MEQVSSLRTAIKYKDTPVGRIPVDWEVTAIKDICKINRGASPRPIGDPSFFSEEGRGWIRISDVTATYKHLKKTSQYLSGKGVSKSVRVNPGDLIMSICATMGKPVIVDIEACIHDGFVLLSDLSERIDKEYLFYFFQNAENKFAAQGQIGTQGNLNTKLVGRTILPLPPLHEQKKIAEILATVDEAIEKTAQVIENIRELKKGLMQRLLTRGIGHKKFKKTEIGEIPEEWEVAHLGDIAKIERGRFSHRPRNAPQFYGGDIPFVQTADIVNSNGRVRNYSQTLNEFGLSISKVFPKGTILITIAANIGYTGILEFDSACPDSLIGITPNEGISATYLHYYLSGERKKMDAAAPQCAQKNINVQILKSWMILLPAIEEQKKIAKAMLAIDDEIGKESNRKEQLETLKKGLMQVLLTGKIRVAV